MNRLSVSIDKKSTIPAYKQLAEQILHAIAAGSLTYSDKLPSERELSISAGLSRGTVKKAYESLCRRGVLVINRGSGTYVAAPHKEFEKSGADQINDLIASLITADYTLDEIRSLFKMVLDERLSLVPRVKVAAVDCNPEALDIIEQQLSSYDDIHFSRFLLQSVQDFQRPEKIFSGFDFIFTTTTHYDELTSLLPGLREKLIKAVISPDMETIVGLNGVDGNARVGIITKSERFAKIIYDCVKGFGFNFDTEGFLYRDDDYNRLADFISTKDVLIIPPLYVLKLESTVNKQIFEFFKDGGRMIVFNYTIEKGSLIYIEEKAKGIACGYGAAGAIIGKG